MQDGYCAGEECGCEGFAIEGDVVGEMGIDVKS